mmetsp:Transcript_11300/g.19018  ORF Transcript_11300/g.19018 Transcript_11300/m.19018 type:complete len:244 (-) Transcript_11300:390-1121(-)
MHKIGDVGVDVPSILVHGHVVVYDQVDLGHVNAPRQHVGADERVDVALPELVDDVVALLDLKAPDQLDRLHVQLLVQLLLEVDGDLLLVGEDELLAALEVLVDHLDGDGLGLLAHGELEELDALEAHAVAHDGVDVELAEVVLDDRLDVLVARGAEEDALGGELLALDGHEQVDQEGLVRVLEEDLVRLVKGNEAQARDVDGVVARLHPVRDPLGVGHYYVRVLLGRVDVADVDRDARLRVLD